MQLKEFLTAQGWKIERESETAFFFHHAPWVAPLAYLHILFRPADQRALDENRPWLRIPESWASSLADQNGAILFSSALNIYGITFEGALLNRKDPFARSPFSLKDANQSWPPKDKQRELVIGGYGYDGTLAVLDREDGTVTAMTRKSHVILKIWPTADEWLTEELGRLAKLYDSTGKLTVDMRATLPTQS